MQADDTSFDGIAGSDDDIVDPAQANDYNESIRSGGDRDDDEPTEDIDDEDRQPGISPNNQ